MDRILTLVLSLLKARVLSLDQILYWDDSLSTVYLFRSHIFWYAVDCCVVRILGAVDIKFS